MLIINLYNTIFTCINRDKISFYEAKCNIKKNATENTVINILMS